MMAAIWIKRTIAQMVKSLCCSAVLCEDSRAIKIKNVGEKRKTLHKLIMTAASPTKRALPVEIQASIPDIPEMKTPNTGTKIATIDKMSEAIPNAWTNTDHLICMIFYDIDDYRKI